MRTSYRDGRDALLLGSQDLCQPVSKCLTRDELEDDLHGGEERLPGTFDSLDLVQDTGVTPSPRVHTPTEEHFQTSLGRRLKTSIGVRISGVGYGEDNLSHLGVALNIHDTKHTANDTGVESNIDDPFANTSSVPNTERESDNKSLGSESYTTAASSLSSNVCKICHCGEEVR